MKKIYLFVVAAFFCLYVTACHYDGDTIINKVEPEHETFDVVIEELTAKEVTLVGVPDSKITLGFRKEMEDIPYVVLDSDLLNFIYTEEGENRRFNISDINADTKQVTITNTKRGNTKAVLDLTKHTLYFENYDLFFSGSSEVYMDPTACKEIAKQVKDDKSYLEITESSNIAGQPVTLDWSTQDVGVVLWKESDGSDVSYELALPLQMVNDVFFSPGLNHLAYNGNKLYLTGNINQNSDYWTSPYQGKERSKAMAKLCYNELCLNLDFNYGLKEIHGIEKFPDFDTYFTNVGIKKSLMSTDPKIFADTLKDVCEFYFGDGHSNYQLNSPYLEPDYKPKGHTSAQSEKYSEEYIKYTNKRKASVTQGKIPGYVLSGNTAIVRFDEFTLNVEKASMENRKTYGDKLISEDILKEYVNYDSKQQHVYEDEYDTVAFIYAVNKTIKKHDDDNPGNKIENIVLDLSCNGGGANHSAAFVLAWMLGECDFAFTNPITGAKWTISYEADVNMDGTAGEDADTVNDKNLFCLISPLSFSCGNMVPAMLKASDRVTILGVASSGGSSCVQPSSAADGTIFRMSSKNVMSINKNGSNYDIDRGVEPHYFINSPANFYDIDKIAALVTKINSGTLQNAENP